MVHTQLKTGFYGTPLIGWKGALGRNVRCWNRPPQVGGEARGEAEAGDRVMCIFLFFMYSLLLWPRKSNKFEFVYIKKVFFFFIEIILRMVLLECFNSRLGWNEMPYFCNYYSVWGSSCKKNGPPPLRFCSYPSFWQTVLLLQCFLLPVVEFWSLRRWV